MRRNITSLTAVAALALALTACGSSDEPAPEKPTAPTTQPAPSTTASKNPGGLPAKPEGAERTALLAALKAVHPALVADEDKAISNARNQCSTITGGGDAQSTAKQRFSTSEHQVSDTEALAINAALQATLCA
ncbi:hypothetical protein ABZ135_12620 [Streptomyces sp. NPDC006339]|uniref:hypothetical protein n=1 Tax=Streptomyces sp. NPDC006339 TaxID=3156755 RepID=UPI0033A59413